ncbi:hypothetical protein D3C80_1449780 [compost metagenome]
MTDAGQGVQVLWLLRDGIAPEELRRADHHRAHVGADGQRDHVRLQALAETHSSIEAGGHHIHQGVVGDDLDAHVRTGFEKPAYQRQQHQLGGGTAGIDTQVARRLVAEAVEVFQGIVDIAECRLEPRIQALARLGQGHATGSAIEQPHAQPLLQTAQGMAERRWRKTQFDRRTTEAQVIGDAEEHRQFVRGCPFHL